MKRYLFPVMLLAMAAPLFGQDPPPAVIPLSDPIVLLAATIFASALTLYKLIDGLKNVIPWFKNNPSVLKWGNFAGNFIAIGGACFALGQVHDLFDVLKCLAAAVMASLVSAGFYESKKASDEARAGGASNLANVKAAVAVAEGKNGGHKK